MSHVTQETLELHAGIPNTFGITILDENDTPIEDLDDVEVTFQTPAGVEVVGETWPLNVPHVADGVYQVALPSDLQVVIGSDLRAHAVSVDGSLDVTFKVEVVAP